MGPDDQPATGLTDPTVVPVRLRPARSFDSASVLVIDYLTRTVPLGMWAVTRVVDGRMIVLTVESPAYGTAAGTEFPYAETMCHVMASGAAPQIAPDVARIPVYAAQAAGLSITIGAYLGTPIVRPDGSLFGTLCGFDPQRQPASLAAHQPLLDMLSSMLSAVLAADTTAASTARALDTALHDAETDTLTGLLNRRGWDRHLHREEERCRRLGDAACIIILDLDHLKIVNDTQGHAAGDRYIHRAGQVLAENTRSDDILARLGGDEFGIIASGATAAQAETMVLRMERALLEAHMSASFGHASFDMITGFAGAWQAADVAMYARKRQRRAAAPVA